MSSSDPKQPLAAPSHVYAAITDMNGIFRGKRVSAEKLDKLKKEGIRMPMSSIGVDIWGTDTAGTQLTMERGDLDGICEATGRGALDLGMDGPVLPLWMRKETGEPYYADGRHLLQLVLDRYKAAGSRPSWPPRWSSICWTRQSMASPLPVRNSAARRAHSTISIRWKS